MAIRMNAILLGSVLIAAVAAGVYGQGGGVATGEDCKALGLPFEVVPGWTIDAGTYVVQELGSPSYGTMYQGSEEYFWVHHNTNIDFYDVTDKANFDSVGNPKLSYTIPSGSTCAQAYSFRIGDDIFTMHGDTPFCTCNWRPEAPCPSRLKITTGGTDTLVTLGINGLVNVDTVVPTVTATAAIAQADGSDGSPPEWGCTELVNPDEVKDKYCITDRGGCFFQTKYERCMEAGAAATIVVNRDDSVITMGVTDIKPNTILIMIGKGDGQIIKDAIPSGDITLSAGKSVGPPQPLAEYSQPDALGVVNAYTGKRDLETAPFILADGFMYDVRNKLLYAMAVDGNTPEVNLVMNASTVVDGSYPVISTFPSSADGSDFGLFYQDGGNRVLLEEAIAWQGVVNLWDVTGDLIQAPKKLSTFNYTVWCPEGGYGFGGTEVHPSGDYIYLTMGIRDPVCPDYDGDGDTGDYVTEIWDISDPENPKRAGDFQLDEVEFGALTKNGNSWTFGPNNIAAIPMTSSGLTFYDFSDPLNPVPVAPTYDPAANTGDFTKGVFSAVFGNDGFWYVYEKDGEDGVHGLFSQIKLIPCGTPLECYT